MGHELMKDFKGKIKIIRIDFAGHIHRKPRQRSKRIKQLIYGWSSGLVTGLRRNDSSPEFMPDAVPAGWKSPLNV
jgi:hypothetical protein